METVTAQIPDGKYGLWAGAVFAGRDISVTICGGSLEHIGAVAMGVARPSLVDAARCSASVSVLCVTGHKEDELAKCAANRLAARFGCVVNICVGIHLDGATSTDIMRLTQNYEQLIELLEAEIDRVRGNVSS